MNVPKMNTPNKLTIFRMIVTPVFLALLLVDIPHKYLWAIVAFSIASITDAIDGNLARKYNQITVFGKLADPVADKILVTSALLGFMQLGLCNIWIVLIILTREFAVTSIRLVASAEGVVIPANIWGKVKTASQMIFSVLIMLVKEIECWGFIPKSFNIPLFSNILLGVTALLAVISGFIYIVQSSKLIDFSK